MTTMINNSQKRRIVLFSGGFDSTYVLAKLVDEAKKGDIICAATIDHNLTGTQKLRREYESQLLILRELRKNYPDIKIEHEIIHIESNWISGDTYNSRGLSQPILWICNLIPLLKDNDEIYLGYNLQDQAFIHIDNIKELVNAACKIQDGKQVHLEFPLKYFNKTEIIRFIMKDFSYLLDLCISCEALIYEGEKVCGECVPCTHLKEALLHISLDGNYYAEQAEKMLKSLFGINLNVTYDYQLAYEADLHINEPMEVIDDYKADCE